MNPDDLMITLESDRDDSGGYTSPTTITLDDSYWNDMNDPREEDIKSMNERLSAIENRLSIIVPDKEMLEKYEVLQDLYNQYKAAEALLSGPDTEKV